MSSNWSCRNIRLEDSTLYTDCRRVNGSYVTSRLQLDAIISNINGVLEWGHNNFSVTAKNVRLEINVMKAELRLGSNISNFDGMLEILNIKSHHLAQAVKEFHRNSHHILKVAKAKP
ncbi:MAG: hypothetical protein Q9209_006601 [Squamulea sp. 1 TL-2023]